MLTDLITKGVGSLLGGIFSIVDQVVEDKDAANKLKASIQEQVFGFQALLINSATTVIVAEANGKGWLQNNWRPLTMVTFVSLIVAKWLGFVAPGVTEAMELKLLDIIEIGLGGYVLGRSAEKIAPYLAGAFKR